MQRLMRKLVRFCLVRNFSSLTLVALKTVLLCKKTYLVDTICLKLTIVDNEICLSSEQSHKLSCNKPIVKPTL